MCSRIPAYWQTTNIKYKCMPGARQCVADSSILPDNKYNRIRLSSKFQGFIVFCPWGLVSKVTVTQYILFINKYMSTNNKSRPHSDLLNTYSYTMACICTVSNIAPTLHRCFRAKTGAPSLLVTGGNQRCCNKRHYRLHALRNTQQAVQFRAFSP